MIKKRFIVFMIVGMTAMFAVAGSGFAQTTHTWSGGAGDGSEDWTNVLNWDTGGPVINGDTVIFPTGGTANTLDTTNDIALTDIDIQVLGTPA